jgi:hypothetical protein
MQKDEWLTPPTLLRKLGTFDLDPCAPICRPWPTAHRHLTIQDDGLAHHWHGRVWMNPPYGKHTEDWMEKLANHGTGTALIFARTETEHWHRHIWPRASAILFLRGRLTFCHVDGTPAKYNGGAPSALIAYGENDAVRLIQSGIQGATWTP